MNKKRAFSVLAISLLLIFAISAPVFAGQWTVSGEIINSETYETIRYFEITVGKRGYFMNESSAKNEVRSQIGFSYGSDTRTVNGVTQRIVWSGASEIN